MRVARAAIARPRLVLAVWFAVVGLLALRGLGVEDRLHRGAITVPGAAAKANAVGNDQFGEGVPLTILLQGPPRQLNRQGRELVQQIERLPHTRALNPWTAAADVDGNPLRPRRDRVLIVVRQDAPFEQQSRETVPRLRTLLREDLRAPVRGHLTGAPDVANGIQTASLDALGRAELIAGPLLMLVLLLVFRSPIAAGIPLLLGMTTIAAARGVIDLLNEVVALDSLALSIASTLGLALGVDYSLLVVSRFREELDTGASPREAARIAAERAGHTVVVAGFALFAAVAIALALAPGSLLASATSGALVAGALSVAAAITVLPALLSVLGPRIDRWRFGRRAAAGRGAGVALAALRRPLVAALAVAGLLVVLAAPALGLQTGPPDVRGLPAASVERKDYEAIRGALGGGWMAPFDIVVTAERGPITAPERLRALDRFQAGLARLRDVDTVFGPAPLADAGRRLAAIPRTLTTARRELRRGQRDQARLAGGMRRVHAGVGQLRAGLGEAADGAAALRAGGARADGGAAQLERGLGRAGRGAGEIVDGLDRSGTGAAALADGVQAALTGVRRLADGVDELRRGSGAGRAGVDQLLSGLRAGRADLERLREPAQLADRQLKDALAALDRMLPTSKVDPSYRRVYEAVGTAAAAVSGRDPRDGAPVQEGYDGLDASLATAGTRLGDAVAGVEQLQSGLDRLAGGLATLDRGVGRLRAGIGRLRAGVRELQDGLARLRSGGGEMQSGLAALQRGAGALDTGTSRLAAGAGRLAEGLDDGAARSAQLGAGVGRMSNGVDAARTRTARLGDGLQNADQLVRITRSGHMLLAAADSAPRSERAAAGLIVSLDRGGSAADITVIARHDPSHAGEPLRPRLEQAAERFSEATGMRALVGGSAPVFQDFDKVSSERLPLLIVGLVALTYLALVAIFRSLVLSAIAVLLNAGTVLAAFGVLALTFQGDDPLLGGPGFLDAISIFGTLSIVFGLSIDYAVFLISRMREGYALTGTTDGAVTYAINGTARIITGAAAIMSGVFLALAVSDVSNLRQLGVGLTVAVMLDATLVRLVLLPALVKLAGPAAWWLPGWLDRLLPGGAAPPSARASGRAAHPPAFATRK